MNLLLATLTAAFSLAVGPPGHNNQGHQQYEVIWTVSHCPMGFLCKRWEATEPNYGQALKFSRLLVQEGYRIVAIIPAPAQS